MLISLVMGMSSKWLPTKWKDLMRLEAVNSNCSMASILLLTKLKRSMLLMLVNASLRIVPKSDSWMLSSCSFVQTNNHSHDIIHSYDFLLNIESSYSDLLLNLFRSYSASGTDQVIWLVIFLYELIGLILRDFSFE